MSPLVDAKAMTHLKISIGLAIWIVFDLPSALDHSPTVLTGRMNDASMAWPGHCSQLGSE